MSLLGTAVGSSGRAMYTSDVPPTASLASSMYGPNSIGPPLSGRGTPRRGGSSSGIVGKVYLCAAKETRNELSALEPPGGGAFARGRGVWRLSLDADAV